MKARPRLLLGLFIAFLVGVICASTAVARVPVYHPAPVTYAPATPKEKSTPTTDAPSSNPPARPRIAARPERRTHKHLARFVFLGADRFECRLDSASFAPCGAIFVRHVAAGRHVLRVRAAGGGPVASFHWRVLRRSA